MNKKERLLEECETKLDALLKRIDSIPARKRSLSIETDARDKNFRDVVMHVYEWQAMLERWYCEGMDGDTPSIPAPGYKWHNLALLNQQIWTNYQDVSLNHALKKLRLSHARVISLIERHTNEELITKKTFKWTKTTNLYTYFAANTFQHYEWALKQSEVIAVKIEEDIKRKKIK
ncbi:ClbS/DfsB family four-helix bundle protein [Shouchella miscanthi]|uniref:ClbS/DfsB family four-helix bundle protein n=1 Tax=Shouchella miscanthi TaxID=2598861 RepID=UPI00119F6B6F|nr:ClbS/DfsB family four-helix bundle protein [Shouchella miscanthi]